MIGNPVLWLITDAILIFAWIYLHGTEQSKWFKNVAKFFVVFFTLRYFYFLYLIVMG